MISILKDREFKEGFILLKRSLNEDNKIRLKSICFNDGKPSWRVADYFSKELLMDNHIVERYLDTYKVYNKYKSLSKDAKGLTLEIKTNEEFDHLRGDGEAWPHLLIEQEFKDEFINSFESLNVKMNLSFLQFESFINEERNDLHTLQVSLYFAIGSRKNNDFFWFGIPFIDFPRYQIAKPYEEMDKGKEDATKKLIYAINPNLYIKDHYNVGDDLSINIDVLPYIKKGFNKAKEMMFLRGVEYDELEIFSINFGFEATGTFNGKIRLSDFDILKEVRSYEKD